jgi:serine protease Do
MRMHPPSDRSVQPLESRPQDRASTRRRRRCAGVALACLSFLWGAIPPGVRADSGTPPLVTPVPAPVVPIRNIPGPHAETPRDWNLRRTPVVEVVRRVRDAVVNIHSERTLRANNEEGYSFTPSQNRVNGMGTGIIIDPRGYIITNQHVVEDVNTIRVRLADGGSYPARMLARDHECDLALLKIDADRPLQVIPLGTVRDLMVGETVVAVGNAYGYEHTVTVGVVSATSRDVTLNKEVSYKALIQTDASINPGNSGGPLLNINGELIGVNVAIRAGAQGIGFAIPVDTMIRVSSQLLGSRGAYGSARSRLGLAVKDEVQAGEEAGRQGTSLQRSLVVESVEQGGIAEQAGLQRADVLVACGDTKIQTSLDLERALLERPAGERVALRYRRRDADKSTEVALSVNRNSATLTGMEGRTGTNGDVIWQKLGVRLAPTAGEAVARTNPQLRGGLVVAEVRPDSPAERAGLLRGDILVGLHQWEMLSQDNVLYVLRHPDMSSFQPLRFYLIRSGVVHRGAFQFDN